METLAGSANMWNYFSARMDTFREVCDVVFSTGIFFIVFKYINNFFFFSADQMP